MQAVFVWDTVVQPYGVDRFSISLMVPGDLFRFVCGFASSAERVECDGSSQGDALPAPLSNALEVSAVWIRQRVYPARFNTQQSHD